MSDEDVMPGITRVEKMIIRFLWTGAIAGFAFGGWVMSIQLQTAQNTRELVLIAEKVTKLAEGLVQDATRVTRVEDSILAQKEQWNRIERKLERIP